MNGHTLEPAVRDRRESKVQRLYRAFDRRTPIPERLEKKAEPGPQSGPGEAGIEARIAAQIAERIERLAGEQREIRARISALRDDRPVAQIYVEKG